MELSEDTRSMEVMVEQLRHELEERDVTIQQLQDGQVPIVSSVPEEHVSRFTVLFFSVLLLICDRFYSFLVFFFPF